MLVHDVADDAYILLYMIAACTKQSPVSLLCFKCRHQKEAEFKLLEEELARKIEEATSKSVEELLNSDEVKHEIKHRIEEGIRKLFDEVDAQLQKEKDAALHEARQKAVSVMHPS